MGMEFYTLASSSAGNAAQVASIAGVQMLIASGEDFHILHRILQGERIGTLFLPDKKDEFYLLNYMEQMG